MPRDNSLRCCPKCGRYDPTARWHYDNGECKWHHWVECECKFMGPNVGSSSSAERAWNALERRQDVISASPSPLADHGWSRERPAEAGLWLMRCSGHVERILVEAWPDGTTMAMFDGSRHTTVVTGNDRIPAAYFAPDVEWKRIAGPSRKQH